MPSPWIGDKVVLVVDGNTITSGRTLSGSANTKVVTAPQTWTNPEVDIPGATKYVTTVQCVDDDDHTDYLVIKTIARAKLPVTVTEYPLGNVAGELIKTGTAYISEPVLDIGLDKATDYSFTISYTAAPSETPNLALSVTDFGSTGQGDASAFVAPTASGGTSTYTIEMENSAGTASALPYGISWSGSAFTGTVNAAAPIGVYRVTVKVTDSASTPVVKYFDCTMAVVA